LVTPDAGADGMVGTADDGRQVWFAPLVLAWPGIVVLAVSARRRVRGETTVLA
jgi:hypothetical protein